MKNLESKLKKLAQRKQRVRAKISGTTIRPRLSVFISNHHITAQIIDDQRGTTLVYASSAGARKNTSSMTDQALTIGTEIAKKAKTAKIKKVVFDRNGNLYHGRIKALADAARAEGLEF